MSGKLEEFLAKAEAPTQAKPGGVEWFASVQCQTCQEDVFEQTLYPTDAILVWECSGGHKSMIENYRAF